LERVTKGRSADYSGLELCYIDPERGLCEWDGDEACLVNKQLIAVNPSVSAKDFGRATQLSGRNHIKDLVKIIDELKEKGRINESCS